MNLCEEIRLRDNLAARLQEQCRNFEADTTLELTFLYMKPLTPKVAMAIAMLQEELREVWCQTDDAIRGV